MDNAARLIVFGTLSAVGLAATFLTFGALFPGVIRRTGRAADQSPTKSFWLGLVNVLFLAALGLGLSAIAENSRLEILQLPALVVFSVLTLLLALGLTAVSSIVGARLLPGASSFRQRSGGAIVLILAALTPFVGWFLLFPYTGLLGVGAVILGWSRARGEAEQAASETEGRQRERADRSAEAEAERTED